MAEDVFGIVGTTQSGSFRVERAVAEGGFSVVYRAQHGAFRAPVALKCLKVPGDLTAEERAAYLERFRTEAELSFRLSASLPEVVRPLHVDALSTRDGTFVPFIALEWLEGGTLAELIARRREEGRAPLGGFKLVRMLSPVARALARAHRFPGPGGASMTIVHGDIKPHNLFVASIGGNEVVKILDLGIATAARAAERKAGVDRAEVLGALPWLTPRYAAPEQWEPERFGPLGPWTDVWALALTMVEALTAEPALSGSREDMRAAALNPNVRPTPRARGAIVADQVEEAFRLALAVDPSERARHIERFWSALEGALGMPATFPRSDTRRDSTALRRSGSAFGKPLPREDPDDDATGRPSVEPQSRSSVEPPLRPSTPHEPPWSPVPSRPPPGPAPVSSPPPAPVVQAAASDVDPFAIPDLSPSKRPPPSDPSPARDSGLPPVLGVLGGAFEPAGDRRSAPRISTVPSEPSLEQDLVLVPSRRPSVGHDSEPPPPPDALDVDLAVSPASLRAAASGASVAMAPASVRATPPNQPEPQPRASLGVPIKVIVAGALVAGVDVALSGAFSLGPVRVLWIGAALVVAGTALFFWRVVGTS